MTATGHGSLFPDHARKRGAMSRRSIALYVALAIAVSWALQLLALGLLALGLWGLNSDKTSTLFLALMWSPTLIALGFIARNRAARIGLRWRLGRPGYLPLGIAVETAIGFVVVAAVVMAGLGSSRYFAFGTGGVAIASGGWLLGNGVQGWPLFLLNISLTAVAYSAFNLVATTGEEFAWQS